MVRELTTKLKLNGRGGGFIPEPQGSSLTKTPSRPFFIKNLDNLIHWIDTGERVKNEVV